MQTNASYRILPGVVQTAQGLGMDYSLFQYYLQANLQQLFLVQNQLSTQLLRNNELAHLMSTASEDQHKKYSSDGSTGTRKNASQFESRRDLRRKARAQPAQQSRKLVVEKQSEESYRPEDDYELEQANIPKNYGKAILMFIKKHETLTKRVLEHLGLPLEPFLQHLGRQKGQINTIRQLRALWTENDNPYAKAFRILSAQYLRKHSLSYIFNSRVQNYGKHVKYRYKILQSVQNPYDFTCMKEF